MSVKCEGVSCPDRVARVLTIVLAVIHLFGVNWKAQKHSKMSAFLLIAAF